MKKLLITICVLVVALSAFCVPAFATSEILPALPDVGATGWVIEKRPDKYIAYENAQITAGEQFFECYTTGRYLIVNGAWVRDNGEGMQNPWTQSIDKTALVYDSSGIYASKSLRIFGIKEGVIYEDFADYLTAYAEQINIQMVVNVLIVLVGATVGLAFMWWGVRKLTRALMTAFKKGRVNL